MTEKTNRKSISDTNESFISESKIMKNLDSI